MNMSSSEPRWVGYADASALAGVLAESIAQTLAAAINERGRASLAVSGGSTPGKLFDALSRTSIAWQHVTVLLVDERYAEDAAARNETLVRERLLRDAASQGTLVPIYSASHDAHAAVRELEQVTAQAPLETVDVLVLGMGADGHTASLFPGVPEAEACLNPSCNASWAVVQPELAPHQRVTMTLPRILSSRRLLLHITGSEKREVLESGLGGGGPMLPIHRVHEERPELELWWSP